MKWKISLKNLFIIITFFVSTNVFANIQIERINVEPIQQPETFQNQNAQNDTIQIYQKNAHASSLPQQRLANALYRYQTAEDFWAALRSTFALDHYENSPQVQAQITYFMNHQDFLQNSANRAAPYLYYILQEVRKRNLPGEIALIPIIESAFNPFAYSSAGAAGIWQMMPATASGYGVKQNWWYDGRRDVIASTKAALTHVIYLRNFFDSNWLLAIAAYDTGQGNVLNAIKKNIRDGYDTSFWSLPLAHETRDYVPRLLALATILANPDKYLVYFPPVRNAPYLAQVDVGRQIDLKRAAQFAGLSLRNLMQLNPGYNRMITGPNGPYRITLPIENVAQFTENLSRLGPAPLNWTKYKVRHGDTLFGLAKRYSSSMLALRKLNKLHSNHIKPGTNLILPHSEKNIMLANVSPTRQLIKQKYNDELTLQKAFVESSQLKTQIFKSQYKLQPGDTVYMTRRGDTITLIAKRFKIPVATLIAANNVNQNGALTSGQRLIVPTHKADFQVEEDGSSTTLQTAELKPGDTIYMVRSGDTMDKIAKRFHTTAPEIRLANLISENELHEGDRLVIPAHA